MVTSCTTRGSTGCRARAQASRFWTAVVLVPVMAMLVGCGARVAPYLGVAQRAGQNPSAGTGSGVLGSTPGAQSPIGPASSGAGGAASSGSNGASTTPAVGSGPVSVPPPQGFSFDPQAEARACPNSIGNTASAPGVTPTSLTIGNVSGLTGPTSGSLPNGPQAVDALFSAVNAAGGICGRKLILDVEDDQQNSTTNASDVQDLIPKVLAFAGSTSDGDNGGVPAMTQANIPDFGFAINCNRGQAPTYWSAAGGSCYQPQGANGPYYINDNLFELAKTSGYFPARLAFLAYSIQISAEAAEHFEYVYQHTFGGSVCYTDFSISPVSASLQSDVEQMRANGCTGVLTTFDVTANAKLLQAMQQQSFSMPYVYTTFDGYTPAQISTAGQSAAQGLIAGLPFVPFNDPNPAVQLYQQQLRTYEPGQQPNGFGALAWEAAQMLIYCLIASGHNPTRASVTKVASSLKNWDGGGAVGPYTPSTRSVAPCEEDVVVKGDDFVRKAPSSGLFCQGQLVQASP